MKHFFFLVTQFTGLILSLLFSAIVIAHPGHGESGEVAHSLDHLFWLGAGASLLACMLYYVIKKRQEQK